METQAATAPKKIKPQGKAPIWAEVKGSSIVRILDRAEWPEVNR